MLWYDNLEILPKKERESKFIKKRDRKMSLFNLVDIIQAHS